MPTEKPQGRMTYLMFRVLRDIAEGRGAYHNCHGRSEHGGRTAVLAGLSRRRLIDCAGQVTPHGRELLAAFEAAEVA